MMSGATNVLETPLAKVRDQIARACAEARRDPASVTLVAISKTFGADAIEPVSTEDAKAMALRLAREEGLFGGTSTGCNVIAALRVAEQLGPAATVVTLMCDTGMKYLRSYGAALS